MCNASSVPNTYIENIESETYENLRSTNHTFYCNATTYICMFALRLRSIEQNNFHFLEKKIPFLVHYKNHFSGNCVGVYYALFYFYIFS